MTTRVSKSAALSLLLVRIGGIALLVGALGYRLGLVGLGPAFWLFGIGLLLSLMTIPIALITALVGRGIPEVARRAGVAAILALLIVAIPVWTVVKGAGAPPIHHVTTDMEDPPQFDAVIPLRGENSNPLDYTSEVAEVQRRAYPDIQPLRLADPPEVAFDRSVAIARELGWVIVNTDREAGRIEATDVTFWFQFEDDVVIRIRPADGGARVDLRSVSRVGGGDVGANAARIREFSRQLAGLE